MTPDELAARYEQYISVISQNDFTKDEAISMVERVQVGPWWGILPDGSISRGVPQIDAVPAWDHVRPSAYKIRFKDDKIAVALAHHLASLAKTEGIDLPQPMEAVAKMFGHHCFEDLIAYCGHRELSVPDWSRSPEKLALRAEEYIRVLMECGFGQHQAEKALKKVGRDGWWKIMGGAVQIELKRANVRTLAQKSMVWRPFLG